MSWARIMAPLAGAPADRPLMAAAATLARGFEAELACIHAPADIADLMPWMGEGFMGGVQVSALESLKEASVEGAKAAGRMVAELGYERTRIITLDSPVWAGLAMESRLSDVIVFDDAAARGRGPLAEAFQQMVADEQRPVVVARPGLKVDGVVLVAWDGGKEASRALRTALPLLQKASAVIVAGAPEASSRQFDLSRISDFLAARGVTAQVQHLKGSGDAAGLLQGAAREVGADMLVAGAFGHPRLQEFIFGGTTRSLLNSDGPSLFLSH
ncbi:MULTISPECIES: universal stress protein [unclassified Caulobacter]|uniref:universal stress protein n=1 Tax=unclassified Caulobacter TaxID=2648921 RepID=UPI000D3880FA|nr:MULTISPECIES: universal stress protein [unclassified Caulobacter]PTS90396.1 universal stress protein UspA [Caulobacter sp. HMWF009]PTT08693.1 universal stress protein UspA [Caulobacter sp. HMWF025]